MRDIEVDIVEKSVAALCIEANTVLGSDIEQQICRMHDQEVDERPRAILEELLENAAVAKGRENMGLRRFSATAAFCVGVCCRRTAVETG